ncbi:hypothetical protein V8G54_017884 [Vigna mungo]|uniref:Protein kinase domain-containing protein n=1 Tax=Vigna mungo TaxID=3915 RepID=A0AAQ3N7L8_VIGMU
MPLFRILVIIFLTLPALSLSDSCPLNFDLVRSRPSSDSKTRCRYILQSLRILQSDYLHRTGSFPPSNASFSCWTALQNRTHQYDIRSSCNLPSSSFSLSCNNITNQSQFEDLLPLSAKQVRNTCNHSLNSLASCALCTKALSNLDSHLTHNTTDCKIIASIYAASFSNLQDPTTADCLFNFSFPSSVSTSKRRNILIAAFCVLAFFLLVFGVFWAYFRLKQKNKAICKTEMGLGSGLYSVNQTTTLIRFTFDEIKKATRNFAGDNIIGKGAYGNVYRGMLVDGTQVALKRFKNCSVAGDASFTHEVEVIASVRHVNLVGLRGYCTATTNLEVTDFAWSLVRNGRALDVIEDGMPELGPIEILEKYVLVAILCCHPQLHARPTMDQVVKMLETEESVSSLSCVAGRIDTEKSVQ